jgi:hypothetical protein
MKNETYTLTLTDNYNYCNRHFSADTDGVSADDVVELFVDAMIAMSFHERTVLRAMEQYAELNKPSYRVEDY